MTTVETSRNLWTLQILESDFHIYVYQWNDYDLNILQSYAIPILYFTLLGVAGKKMLDVTGARSRGHAPTIWATRIHDLNDHVIFEKSAKNQQTK